MYYGPYQPDEKDWKLFRKKLPEWQENYMERMIKDYADILSQDKKASDIFWELEKRIWKDKKKTGVIARDLKRSNMFNHILDLLMEGAITLDDLEGFDNDLQEKMHWLMTPRN